jgi:hypothetical protein
MRGLIKFAGWDPDEMPIYPRGPATRWTETQVAQMLEMVSNGASGVEVARALDLKPQCVRAKLWQLGVKLRRRTLKTRIRMVVDISKRLRDAAEVRGISPQQLIRRLLVAIVEGDWFDEILGRPFHSLGAAATYEPAAGRAGAAAVADAGSSVAAVTFAVVLLRTPQLGGCCARLG